jgi:hypothetical protein
MINSAIGAVHMGIRIRGLSVLAVLMIVSGVLLSGCSSTGTVSKSSIVAPQTVQAPENVHPEVAPYVPNFVEALVAAGFDVGITTDPNALQLKIEFNPNVFNIRVAASLMQRGVPIVTASATNPGWGTALARGVAVNGRAEAALESFKEQLTELSPRLKIVPDSMK